MRNKFKDKGFLKNMVFRHKVVSAGVRVGPCSPRGTPNRRLIGEGEYKGHTYVYHATKGYRRYSLNSQES